MNSLRLPYPWKIVVAAAVIALFATLATTDVQAQAADAEAASAKLAAECAALDRELAAVECAKTITDLSRRRAQVAEELAKAEAHWLEVSEQLELLAA